MIIDTNTSCSGKAKTLRDMNVDVVGRYYRLKTHPAWRLTQPEAIELSKEGISLFSIFEDYGFAKDLKLTRDQGKIDAASALSQASAVGQPEGSAIYFAVEGLRNGYKKSDLPKIRDYFGGIHEILDGKYNVGVYGDGLVCETLLKEGTCKYTWLAAASTSFAGTKQFLKSWRWSFAQMGPLDISVNGLSVDIDVATGAFGGFQVS